MDVGPADFRDCGKEKIDSKKRTRLKLIIGLGIAAIIIVFVLLLTNYFGTPSAIAQSMFYKDYPGATIISVKDGGSDSGLHRIVWIAFNYPGKVILVHGRYYDVIAYEFEFTDYHWAFTSKFME